MDENTAPALVSLTIAAAACAFTALYIANKTARLVNFRTLVLLNYMIAIPVSGVVHIVNRSSESRGYFDMFAGGESPTLIPATLAAVLGSAGLITGCLYGGRASHGSQSRSHLRPEWVQPRDRGLIWVVAVILILGGLLALAKIVSYAEQSGLSRIISLNQGLARYSYISSWTIWGISLLVILVSSRFHSSAPIKSLVLTCIACASIASVLFWTGGRSIILVMTIPIVMVMIPRLKGTRLPAVVFGVIGIAYYFVSVTASRLAQSSTDDRGLASWLDWQWGRFSMLGFADSWSDTHGLLLGETFHAAFNSVTYGVLGLAHVPLPRADSLSSFQITGRSILNSSTDIYIVPGLPAELYLNFGLVGVPLGLLLLGRITTWVDNRFVSASSSVTQLAWAYVGSLLLLRTVTADSGALPAYLVFQGAPLLILACIIHVRRTHTDGLSKSTTVYSPEPRVSAD